MLQSERLLWRPAEPMGGGGGDSGRGGKTWLPETFLLILPVWLLLLLPGSDGLWEMKTGHKCEGGWGRGCHCSLKWLEFVFRLSGPPSPSGDPSH